MRKTKGFLLIFVLAAFFSTGLTCAIAAQEKEAAAQAKPEVKRQVIKRQLVGEVGGIARDFIAVDYEKDGKATYEMALAMDKSTKGYRRDLKDINLGDLVAVTYEEISEVKEGQKPKIIKRLAKVVEFRQAAKVTPETGVLESKEQ
jgi:hypothetical protein